LVVAHTVENVCKATEGRFLRDLGTLARRGLYRRCIQHHGLRNIVDADPDETHVYVLLSMHELFAREGNSPWQDTVRPAARTADLPAGIGRDAKARSD
jgi:hypothetical protein